MRQNGQQVACCSNLYWVGNTLSLATFGFSIYIASLRPAHIDGSLWFTVIALFIATVVVWLMLKRPSRHLNQADYFNLAIATPSRAS